MKAPPRLDSPASPTSCAYVVGVSVQALRKQMADGRISGATNLELVRSYCERLRRSAAGRSADPEAPDGPDPAAVQTARLKAAQADAQELKNAVTRGEQASVELLADTLATAAKAVADQFDLLDARVRRSCPDLAPAALEVVKATIAAARNEWVASTAALLTRRAQEEGDDADSA